jgi:putative alpha-1,2-mannosidase
MGCKNNFTNRLDSLFYTKSDLLEEIPMDVSGFIGQSAHGDERSHHIVYLYDYGGKAWKTQEKVIQILPTLYDYKPSGLYGKEFCGQMSAWYVFSALGFYPVNPYEGIYVIGRPVFKESYVKVSENCHFSNYSLNFSTDNQYIQLTSMG